jgi:hypothetical protein
MVYWPDMALDTKLTDHKETLHGHSNGSSLFSTDFRLTTSLSKPTDAYIGFGLSLLKNWLTV